MKMKLKPWQIGLIATAGVVVLGGAGTGIYFGVNRSIDDKVKEQVDAAMESVYSSEAALDESETPSQAAGEITTESTTAAQPTKEPETVIDVAPTETEKSETSPAPDPQPEPEPEPKPEIELVYDEQLTKEVAELLSKKYSSIYGYTPMSDDDYIAKQTEYLENGFNANPDGSFKNTSTGFSFSHQYDDPTAEKIVSDWDSIIQTGSYGLIVWRATGNWVLALIAG